MSMAAAGESVGRKLKDLREDSALHRSAVWRAQHSSPITHASSGNCAFSTHSQPFIFYFFISLKAKSQQEDQNCIRSHHVSWTSFPFLPLPSSHSLSVCLSLSLCLCLSLSTLICFKLFVRRQCVFFFPCLACTEMSAPGISLRAC